MLSAQQAIELADRVEKVQAVRRQPGVVASAYLKGDRSWQVSYHDRRDREVAQVIVDDPTRQVTEAWTGAQVAWMMARGYPGAFGRIANAVWIWVPLCVLFVAPFVDPRRPFRLLHLDLLVLVGFSVSLAFFNHARIGVSVPLAYPLLAYLLVRLLLVARRASRGGPREPLRLLVPPSWLVVGILFLVGFRVALNVADSNVIDVGYSGVIGADRLVHGQPIYNHFPADDEHGDTYGPVAYEAYVPFELALPWSGRWDDLPAAHAAAIAFDLLVLGLLFLLGRRVRGPGMGVALAWAWAAYPFTLFTLSSNANDALVGLLVLLALVVGSAPAARGGAAALAGFSKFAPLALAPLLATWDARAGRASLRPGRLLAFALGFAAIAALVWLPILGEDPGTVWSRTLGFQDERGSPFAIWGAVGGLGGLQRAVQLGALALALVVAVVPRRRDLVTVAALAGAVLVAVQLGLDHWFYLYLAWFLPLAFVALLARHDEPVTGPVRVRAVRAAGWARSRPRALARTR